MRRRGGVDRRDDHGKRPEGDGGRKASSGDAGDRDPGRVRTGAAADGVGVHMGWEGEAGTVDPVRKTDGVGNRSRGTGAFAAERLRALLFVCRGRIAGMVAG